MMRCPQSLESIFASPPRAVEGGTWYFREVTHEVDVVDSLDRLKYMTKRWPRLYRLITLLLSPVLVNSRPERRFLSESGEIFVNLGSGNHRVDAKVWNVDMFAYEQVDVVADIHRLPFKDGSVDAIMSVAVLEHVADPQAVVREMFRVLKPGGLVYNLIPFMQPFHASPHDYQRYTSSGIAYLHREFEQVEVGVGGGPISGFLWVFQEAVATLLSFGWPRLRDGIYLAVMVLTWPVKFLDLLFRDLPTATNLASSFYVLARKPKTTKGGERAL
ncbi:MAG TPA: class I SAM-dependent methyltransferase [Kiritimatiellia bacterium]|nr:class I SAM-dependent methyltransferase [Kiritimatiellia bacterium]